MNRFLRTWVLFGAIVGVGFAVAIGITQKQRPLTFCGTLAVGLMLGLVGGYSCAMLGSLGSRDPIAPYAKPPEKKRENNRRAAKKRNEAERDPGAAD